MITSSNIQPTLLTNFLLSRAAARVGKGTIVGFTLEKDGKLVCGATLEEAIKAVDKATSDQVKI